MRCNFFKCLLKSGGLILSLHSIAERKFKKHGPDGEKLLTLQKLQ